MSKSTNILKAFDKQLGERIQGIRLASGLSRAQLSRHIGVTHQQLEKYEKGINRISVGRLIVIAKALNQPMSYFYEQQVMQELPIRKRVIMEMSRNLARINNDGHINGLNILIRNLAENVN